MIKKDFKNKVLGKPKKWTTVFDFEKENIKQESFMKHLKKLTADSIIK